MNIADTVAINLPTNTTNHNTNTITVMNTTAALIQKTCPGAKDSTAVSHFQFLLKLYDDFTLTYWYDFAHLDI